MTQTIEMLGDEASRHAERLTVWLVTRGETFVHIEHAHGANWFVLRRPFDQAVEVDSMDFGDALVIAGMMLDEDGDAEEVAT